MFEDDINTDLLRTKDLKLINGIFFDDVLNCKEDSKITNRKKFSKK